MDTISPGAPVSMSGQRSRRRPTGYCNRSGQGIVNDQLEVVISDERRLQPKSYYGTCYNQAALNYQKQILQWQQAVGQRVPQGTFNTPWVNRGYGDYRQDPTAPVPSGSPEGLPPQPTIVAPVAPVAPGQTDTPPTYPPPPTPQPLPEVDNQLGGETTPPPTQDPLRALCKAPRGQFPGTSCGKFVNCWDDVVVEQDCPLGLYFNENGGYCDYAFNVGCIEKPGQQPGAGGGQVPGGVGGSVPGQVPDNQDLGAPGARCPTEYGTYRSNKNCGVFYMCVGYLPFEFTCPAGLNFHKDLQVCDYPYRVECDGVPSNQPPPEVTAVPEGETTYPPGPPSPPPAPVEVAPQPEIPGGPPSAVESPQPPPPSPPVLVSPEPTPAVAPPATPEAFYNLKRLPANLANPGVPCQENTVFRLNPSCSSVAVCRNGYTQVLNCGPGTSYDSYSGRCVSYLRARC